MGKQNNKASVGVALGVASAAEPQESNGGSRRKRTDEGDDGHFTETIRRRMWADDGWMVFGGWNC